MTKQLAPSDEAWVAERLDALAASFKVPSGPTTSSIQSDQFPRPNGAVRACCSIAAALLVAGLITVAVVTRVDDRSSVSTLDFGCGVQLSRRCACYRGLDPEADAPCGSATVVDRGIQLDGRLSAGGATRCLRACLGGRWRNTASGPSLRGRRSAPRRDRKLPARHQRHGSGWTRPSHGRCNATTDRLLPGHRPSLRACEGRSSSHSRR